MTIYNVQPSYPTGISLVPYVVGEVVDMETANTVTRNCETAAGIAFGLACGRGLKDGGCVIGGANFVGISVRDITLDPINATSMTPDVYPQNSNVALITFGAVAVVNSGAAGVVPGAAVTSPPPPGAINPASGTAIPGAQWQTTTASGAVGVIKLGTMT